MKNAMDDPVMLAELIAQTLTNGGSVPAHWYKRLRDLQGTHPYTGPDNLPSRLEPGIPSRIINA